MKTLRQCLAEAVSQKRAIGHFNISNLDMLWGVFRAAQDRGWPVIIGVSEGERDFMGVRPVAALVRGLREQYHYPVFLNADHTYSLARVREAIDAGFDSVIFDGSKLPLDKNVAETRASVEYARAVNPEILVEGEIGYIGTSSRVLEELPDAVSLNLEDLPKPEECARFVEATGVDLLSPAVGNIHGMFRGGDPALQIDLVRRIHGAVPVPLVLHGASGNSDNDVRAAIAAGVAIVHVNTELRVAYRDALSRTLADKPDEVAPYKYLAPSVWALGEVVGRKMDLFYNCN